MKLAKMLQNPFALVVQGFAVGTILVFAPNPLSTAEAAPIAAQSAAPPAASAAI